jgi:hypothetical protein
MAMSDMRLMRLVSVSVAVLVSILIGMNHLAEATADPSCRDNGFGVVNCGVATDPVEPRSSGLITNSEFLTKSLDCGTRGAPVLSAPTDADGGCRSGIVWCTLPPGQTIDPTKRIVVDQIYNATTRILIRTDINCDAAVGPPMPSIAAIKAEAAKRAPRPHTASGGTNYLVNGAVVFYATPPAATASLADVRIPLFNLSGHTFDIHLTLTKTVWTWGDDTSTSYTSGSGHPLGIPYSDSVPCESHAACSSYISHAYAVPGTFTVTAEAHWTGSYALDRNSQPIPIPGDLFVVDPVGRTVSIQQAHAELVAPS